MADRKEPPFYNDHSTGAFQYKLPFYETMELFIETLTGTCFELRVSPFEAVISVKAKIQRLEGIPVAQQHLIWNNLELDDEYCLHDYGIAEGCTLKLVLAMRGGPINTRRVIVEDPMKEVAELMEGSREEGCGGRGVAGNKQVTFLVYREGDQLNFFRVVDRGDGTLTPLSESISGSSVYNVYSGDDEADGESCAAVAQQSLENSITMNKMKLLKAKMEDMNLNKKMSAKLKPHPPAGPPPCSGPLGPPGARSHHHHHHHRLFRALPQLSQPRHAHTHLPPLRDRETACSSPPTAAAAAAAASSARLSPLARRAPPPFSSSCYMLQEEEPWETCPPLAKIRPPPAVSRLDAGGGRSSRDCVYPQLPPLSTRTPRPPGGTAPEALELGFPEAREGPVEPAPPGAPAFGELLSEPLSLDVSSSQAQVGGGGGLRSPEFPPSPSLLSTWTIEPSDRRTPLGCSMHIGPPSTFHSAASPPVPAGRPLPQPFEFTGSPSPSPTSTSSSSSYCNPQAQAAALLEPSSPSPPYPSFAGVSPPRPVRLRGVKVDTPGKRPEIISKKEARGITKLANHACKEPLGTLSNSQLLASLAAAGAAGGSREAVAQGLGLPSAARPPVLGSKPPAMATGMHLFQDDLLRQISPPLHRAAVHTVSQMHSDASNSLGSAGGTSTSFRRLGTPTYHLPPVKAPVGSKKKSAKHCFLCGRKTGLATSYECRCGNNFCATHRYAETHDCSYDYKGAGRRFLQDTHPVVSAPKLPKI
ncbi:AN1-type zinc finger protein 4 [Merluccius polli]|uniref:AN1-type zinc finger protein 4 n=1 Tax=Merluccius polli TaxID=89951 RepID=A0AA47NLR6_MERPO|nr:AN1-type zinc finger protein 4 [Merluccius polli]